MAEPAAEPRCRARDLGLSPGEYAPGPFNAITDVAGVRVGHATLIAGDGPLFVGRGPVRTGVTAVLPNDGDVFLDRVVGGAFVLNGAGEVTGLTQLVEWGLIETPIMLTNTLSVPACAEGVLRHLVARYPGIGQEHDVVIPLVGECDDSWLNDIAGRHVRVEHALEAIEGATSGPVAEGNVGAGTGMITCDLKGGLGTASRVLPEEEGGYTLGVLVQSNFGRLVDLRMDGVPVGERLLPWFGSRRRRTRGFGSLIAVVATDAPLATHQLNRLARRCALGLGRVGSYAANGSGEIVLGFSTANRVPRVAPRRTYQLTLLSDDHVDPLYRAVIEATEEAVLNALCAAGPMTGVDDHHVPALPLDEVRAILSRCAAAHGGSDLAERDHESPAAHRLRPHARDEPRPHRGPGAGAGPIQQVGRPGGGPPGDENP